MTVEVILAAWGLLMGVIGRHRHAAASVHPVRLAHRLPPDPKHHLTVEKKLALSLIIPSSNIPIIT